MIRVDIFNLPKNRILHNFENEILSYKFVSITADFRFFLVDSSKAILHPKDEMWFSLEDFKKLEAWKKLGPWPRIYQQYQIKKKFRVIFSVKSAIVKKFDISKLQSVKS